MTYPINYPTPQDCDVQFFYGLPVKETGGINQIFGWVKPKGASFVWFTLIGGGGPGGNSGDFSGGGGGSGAVTNCLMPAFLVPDELRVSLGGSGNKNNDTRILYQGPQASAGYVLLRASGSNGGSEATGGPGGVSVAKSAFAAAGFYQSTTGASGSNGVNIPASTTTFLSGGTSESATVTPNYGYPTSSTASPSGFFQMSTIIVGRGGQSNVLGEATPGGLGCGGGGPVTGFGGAGGAGMVVIISW
jgi:hypothetical protein